MIPIPNRDKEREFMFKKAEAEIKMKDPKKVKEGKTTKAQGSTFELRTRKDLEEKDWIVSKWQNNVEFDFEADDFYKVPRGTTASLKPAKAKFRGMGIPMALGTGMPDFVCFRKKKCSLCDNKGYYKSENGIVPCLREHNFLYEVIGVESKMSGTLSKIEKQKCRWYLDKGIFSRILVSKKTKVKNKIVVEYIDFLDIEKRMK